MDKHNLNRNHKVFKIEIKFKPKPEKANTDK